MEDARVAAMVTGEKPTARSTIMDQALERLRKAPFTGSFGPR